MPSLRAVLCDLDDTLFDHAQATREALAGLHGAEPGFGRWTLPEFEQRHADMLELMHQQVLSGRLTIEAARNERFRRLLVAATAGDATHGLPAELARRYRSNYERAWQPVRGAVALLAALKRAGLSVGVVTNNITSEQLLKLVRCGLDQYVDALVTSEDVGAMKPDARVFQAALTRLDATPPEAVMIGDIWLIDVAGARAAGLRAVWLNRLGQANPDPSVPEVRALEPLEDVWRAIWGGGTAPYGAECDRV